MLALNEVSVRYNAVRALDGVSFDAAPGSITAILGANGAGKTTLLRTLSGLLRPHSGSMSFGGRVLERLAVEDIVRLGIVHVPEGRGVIAELTVEENLRLGGLWRRNRAELAESQAMVYDLFPPLAAARSRQAATLSGGERQMLAIGRGLAGRPQFLLLDEPSLGLAPKVVASIMAVVRKMRDETGMGVLLVEQNARSALSIADRVVVLSLGRVAVLDDAAPIAGDERLRHAYLGF